jgi:hypothetical protein
MAIGRISGPLLKANLIRDGVDLAFETDLLYLDVNNSRVGVNRADPQYALDIVGTLRTTDLQVQNSFNLGNLSITGNTISSNLNTISFVAGAGEATIYHSRLIVNDIELNGNTISTTVSNSNLELRPNGTGTIELLSTSNVTGDLNVTGNINADGNITIGGNLVIGDQNTDTVTINASIQSSLIPKTDNTYDLGSTSYRWKDVFAVSITATNLNLNTFTTGNLFLSNNTITTTAAQDLILEANGTGGIRIGNFKIVGNTITNTVADSVTTINQNGTGYVKISGTNGFVPPRGTSSERPNPAVEGMMRYNTDSKALEIWDGSVWASPAGTIGAVSEGTANDIAVRFALTLG